jgi:DNA (cytosine-5)-methyltransferase 1
MVIENVVHMRKWDRYKGWIKKIQSLGYQVRTQVINAADHGVPQSRRRLFILCDRETIPKRVEPTARKQRTAKSIICPNGVFPFSPLNTPKRAPATLERAARAIKQLGQSQPFLLVYYGSDAAGGWQTIERPLRTLTTLDRFGYVRPVKGGHEMRMLQVSEIKAAMGFPNKHHFDHGSRREKIKLLGNAVCPPVMKAAVKSLIQKV